MLQVKRWTKEVDLFAQDILLVPIHRDMHWSLAIVWNMKDAAAAYRQAWLTQHGTNARSSTATATGTATTAAAGAAGTVGMGGKSPAAAAKAATTAVAIEDSLLPVSIMYLDSMSSGLHGVEICRTLHR